MDRNLTIGYGYALAGALAYGAAQVATRAAVKDETSPLTAATISMFAGMLALGFMNMRDLGAAARQQRRALVWVALSGLFSSVGVLSMYWALSLAPVMVATPISSVNPLLTLLLAHFFLARQEKITRRVVGGAVLVVVGVVLIAVGRNL
ncbi:MAG: DMT family transporter [Chloroflexi bacterium]|nr:DMT family transporter [Chloroflexota bacterium]